MKYLNRLDGDDNDKLATLLRWVNDAYDCHIWTFKTGKTKKKVNRAELRDLQDTLVEIMELRNLPCSREEKRDGSVRMLFGKGMAHIDMPALCAELRKHFRSDLSIPAEKTDGDTQRFEDFYYLWLLTRKADKLRKPDKKLLNKVLLNSLEIHDDWHERYKAAKVLEADDNEQHAWPPYYLLGNGHGIPLSAEELVDSIRACAEWLRSECSLPKAKITASRLEAAVNER